MRDASFLVEDFIHAITTQLDRVQDALRLKAVNRPLTYALKDMSLELRVFVEMDAESNVRFRNSGPNESGASVVHLGFTTITKPMIEENTISMAATRSPTLDELGLSREEQQKFERMGVRNAAQLNTLGRNAGLQTVSRLTALPVDRLRGVLGLAKPSVGGVTPHPSPPASTQPPKTTQPPIVKPPVVKPPVVTPPVVKPPVVRPPVITPRPGRPGSTPSRPPRHPVTIPPKTHLLGIEGTNLLALEGEPEVRLNGRPLAIREIDDDRLLVEEAEGFESGALEIILPDGESVSYELSVEEPETPVDDLGFDEYDPALARWGAPGE